MKQWYALCVNLYFYEFMFYLCIFVSNKAFWSWVEVVILFQTEYKQFKSVYTSMLQKHRRCNMIRHISTHWMKFFIISFRANLSNWWLSYLFVKFALRWLSLYLTDDKSKLVKVMASCRQARQHPSFVVCVFVIIWWSAMINSVLVWQPFQLLHFYTMLFSCFPHSMCIKLYFGRK